MFDKVFFLMAPNYHGSTMISRVLNEHSEISTLGDTYPTRAYDQTCGCGNKVSQCAFWNAVQKGVGKYQKSEIDHWLELYPPIGYGGFDKFIYGIAKPTMVRRMLNQEKLSAYVRSYTNFIEMVQKASGDRGKRVFVDGVKSIARVQALRAGGFEAGGLICVRRNLREYLYSTKKTNERTGEPFRPARAIVEYVLYYRLCRWLSRTLPSITIDYEQFCNEWEKETTRIVRFIGLKVEPIKLHSQKSTWHFMGNISVMNFQTVEPAKKYPKTDRQIERLVKLARVLSIT